MTDDVEFSEAFKREVLEAMANEAVSYFDSLVRDYGGYLREHREMMGGGQEVVILTLQVRGHPAPPGTIGWRGAAPTDERSQMMLRIKLAVEIRKDLKARLGDPSDPDNCTCYGCYRSRGGKG
jgi:hypothetical protein